MRTIGKLLVPVYQLEDGDEYNVRGTYPEGTHIGVSIDVGYDMKSNPFGQVMFLEKSNVQLVCPLSGSFGEALADVLPPDFDPRPAADSDMLQQLAEMETSRNAYAEMRDRAREKMERAMGERDEAEARAAELQTRVDALEKLQADSNTAMDDLRQALAAAHGRADGAEARLADSEQIRRSLASDLATQADAADGAEHEAVGELRALHAECGRLHRLLAATMHAHAAMMSAATEVLA